MFRKQEWNNNSAQRVRNSKACQRVTYSPERKAHFKPRMRRFDFDGLAFSNYLFVFSQVASK
jgi:hypothetical protein